MLLCFVREALLHDNPPRSRCPVPGLRCRFPAQSRQRKPTILSLRRQSGGRGLRRDGCMGALGSTARSLATKSQTNLVLSVRSACFATQERNAPCSRLLLVSWPGEASRPYCRGLGRYAEHRGLCCLAALGAPLSVPVSAVCGRRNEREHPAKSAKLSAAANGAGGKLTSPASGAGETVRKR